MIYKPTLFFYIDNYNNSIFDSVAIDLLKAFRVYLFFLDDILKSGV